MHELILWNNSMPVINGCDKLVAPEDFLHADRILDFHVLIYVVEGAIYVTEDDVDYDVEAGGLMFLKAGVHHYGKYKISRGTRWHFVHFYLDSPMEHPETVSTGIAVKEYHLISDSMPLPKQLFQLQGTDIEQQIFSLTEAAHSADAGQLWAQNARLFALLSDIGFYNQTINASTRSDSRFRSVRICNFLKEHMKEPFRAENLEAHFYLSYKHMAAVFKKEQGITMQAYHNMLRMEQACRLLQTTLLSIGEIAEKLGFSDLLYFSRCFHKYSGMSPSAYRKAVLSHY